ncbi:MAG: outer membrane lipoprotein carrier protein LolA [Proteobacteria bacterium]|nr:outer membrane lipoprotein carrier protein LolA [Pseudomonadota bacterium]
MTNKFCCFVPILFIFSTTILSATEEFSNFVDQHFSRIHSFQSDFHQVYYDSQRDSKSESFGKVRYAQPGRMHWSYQRPDELEVYIGKEKIWIVDPLLENVTIQELDKVTQMNALSFLLNKEKLREHFKVIKTTKSQLDISSGLHRLSLSPKKKSPNLLELQIGYDRNSFEIKQFVVVDEQGNYRRITFSKVNINLKMDLKSFEFQVPNEMEIIDGL